MSRAGTAASDEPPTRIDRERYAIERARGASRSAAVRAAGGSCAGPYLEQDPEVQRIYATERARLRDELDSHWYVAQARLLRLLVNPETPTSAFLRATELVAKLTGRLGDEALAPQLHLHQHQHEQSVMSPEDVEAAALSLAEAAREMRSEQSAGEQSA